MGQYYKPINLDKQEWLYSHDFDNGLKLMEHSYLENTFVEAVEALLTPFGSWHKDRLVWAGDYADGENEDEYKKYADIVAEFTEQELPSNGGNLNLYGLADKFKQIAPYEVRLLVDNNKIDLSEYHYICNHTEKEYFDKRDAIVEDKEYNLRIHWLPLLTAEGNGRGGGDYYEDNPDFDFVGVWARHSISVEKEIPLGYKYVRFDFTERATLIPEFSVEELKEV